MTNLSLKIAGAKENPNLGDMYRGAVAYSKRRAEEANVKPPVGWKDEAGNSVTGPLFV